MADTILKKGGGIFTWIENDPRPEAWGIIFKSDNNPSGSWVRQDIIELNPDWFGAMNAKITFRNLGYTQPLLSERFGKYIPDISEDDTPDWAALQMMCRMQELGFETINLTSTPFYINRTVRLPENTIPNDSRLFQIYGNGAWIYSINQLGYPFFKTMPADQRTSQNTFTARRFTIKDLCIKGDAAPGSGSVGIAIGGTFHSLLENITLEKLDTGIVFRHAMSSEIYRCNTVNCFRVSFYMGSGVNAWTGANSTNSGSNQSKVTSCRMVSWTNQRAGVVISQSSECRVTDFTIDGGEKKHTDYAVLINTGGSTTVKDGFVSGIHAEAMVDSAIVKFRGSGNALFHVKDLFIQYEANVIELETISGYSQVICENISYMPSSSTFSNKGNGGSWHFINVFDRNKEPQWRGDPPLKDRVRNIKRL